MNYVNIATIVTFMPGVAHPLPTARLWPWLAVTCIAGPFGHPRVSSPCVMPMHWPRRGVHTRAAVLAMAGATLAFR